jgi:hypothetical protein
MKSEGMTDGAAVAVGSHHHNMAKLLKGFSQCGKARRVNAVVVGHQNQQKNASN